MRFHTTYPQNEDDEELLSQALSSLTPKPRARRPDTLYSLVHRCFSDLKSAKEKGYSYEDLATLFQTQLGKTITPGTLRKYMNRAAKEVGGAVDANVDPVPRPQKAAPISTPVRKPSGEEKRLLPPRSTLFTNDHRAQVSEDEFENL